MGSSLQSLLDVQKVSKSFDTAAGGLVAVSEVSFSLHEGAFLSILGPSGCGKTTLLRMIGGLLPVSEGRILLQDKPITRPDGQIVLLFQEYGRSLLPWRRVLPNVEMGLEAKGMKSDERRTCASHFLRMVGLGDFESHFPWQLSGGMQQRVALARALACAPKVLLMDEPFGSLDARTREELEDELLRIWSELNLTVVFVTHNIEEAIYLGQRVILLSHRPAKIRFLKDVRLGYPREQLTTRESKEFLDLRATLHKALRVE